MDALSLAKQICETLRFSGHLAYLAGGYVRDTLLGIASDDIDIATNATPDEIVQLFPDHVLVGAQFGVVLVLLNSHQFEVATFRHDLEYTDGRKPTQISFNSSPEEDAARRDFTINGMFMDPFTGQILDFVGGREDIEKKHIRAIGDPRARFRDDRLRMIRAVRFSARFGFPLEKETRAAIEEMAASLLPAVSMERILQELQKMRAFPNFRAALLELHALGLLAVIFKPLKNVPLDVLQARLNGIDSFSDKVPTLLFLAKLFDHPDKRFIEEMPKYLRASNEDGKWIECYLKLKRVDFGALDRYELATLFADPCFDGACEALLLPETTLQYIQERKNELSFFVDLFRKKELLVRGADLEKLGIPPGKEMGRLLEEAKKIAVNKNLRTKEAILAELNRS